MPSETGFSEKDIERMQRRALIKNELANPEVGTLSSVKDKVRHHESEYPILKIFDLFEKELFPMSAEVKMFLEDLSAKVVEAFPKVKAVVTLGSVGKGGFLIRQSMDNLNGTDLDLQYVFFENPTWEEIADIEKFINHELARILSEKRYEFLSSVNELHVCRANKGNEFRFYSYSKDQKLINTKVEHDGQAFKVLTLLMPIFPTEAGEEIHRQLIKELEQLAKRSILDFDSLAERVKSIFFALNQFPEKYVFSSPLNPSDMVAANVYRREYLDKLLAPQAALLDKFFKNIRSKNLAVRVLRAIGVGK